MKTDPVFLEIFRNKATAVTEEMGIALQRTGRTLYVKETADFGTALATRDGKFFAFPNAIGVAGFVDLDCAVTISAVGALEPGDVIITNHPYESGGLCTHTPDIQLVRPYFHDGAIVGYGWSFIHSADIGGKVPSSISPTNTELYQEGLLIPPLKLMRRGAFNEDFLTMFRANCRSPALNIGDVKAMLAALEVGQRRVSEMIDQHGLEAFLQAQEDLLDYAARKARDALRHIPDGTYTFWDYLDDDMLSAVPVRIRVAMTVEDGRVRLDFGGSDLQTRAPFNIPTMGRSHPWLTLRMLAYIITRDPSCPVNSGVFRNIEVRLQRGSMLHPEFPAPTGVRHASGGRCYDVLNGALARAMPDFMPAPPGGAMLPVVLVEPDDSGGQLATVVQFMVGATGARAGADGVDGRDPSFTNMSNNPIETVEAESAATILHYGVRPDSGGAGQWRGGCGQIMTFRVGKDGCSLLGRGAERFRFVPWGLAGGRPGTPMRIVLNLGTKDERELGKIDMVPLDKGDVVTVMMAGAGGYGDPLARDPDRVLLDVERGFISPVAAERDYGVVIAEGAVDRAATEALRARRAPGAPQSLIDTGSERAAWESVCDDARMCALVDRLLSLPIPQRQRAWRRFFEALEPRLTAGGSAACPPLHEMFADPESLRGRFDRLLAELG